MKKRIFFAAAGLCVSVLSVLPGCGNREAELVYEDFLPDSSESFYEETEECLTGEPDSSVQEPEKEKVVVHICGAVVSPGVYALEADSRLCDAVELAGGLSGEADAGYRNLAKKLTDGEQIYIPTREEVRRYRQGNETVLSPVEGTEEKTETGEHKVNINTAGLEELCTLPGIGEARAESILAYREEHGQFGRIEDIMKISGIKEAAFSKLKDKIDVK